MTDSPILIAASFLAYPSDQGAEGSVRNARGLAYGMMEQAAAILRQCENGEIEQMHKDITK